WKEDGLINIYVRLQDPRADRAPLLYSVHGTLLVVLLLGPGPAGPGPIDPINPPNNCPANSESPVSITQMVHVILGP
ncbi:hypothetical protein B296_00042273, partial [Ensete ventricosum]